MEFKIIYKKRFLVSLSKVLDYLEIEWGEKVSKEFYDVVSYKIEQLKTHPYAGSLSLKGARTIHITKHNRLFYRIEKGRIIIVNLYDTRKKNYNL